MSTIHCKNCNKNFHGNFCPNCGQAAKVTNINAQYFLHDIPHSIFHVDKGFWYTLKWMFTNPGKTLKEYLEGKRVQHFKPFAFVVIMSTIATLLSKFCMYLINLRMAAMEPGKIITSGTQNLFSEYPSLLIFILIPILSLITWLCFRKRKYNYWEHFLVNTYLAAYLNVFFLVIKIVQLIKFYTTGNFSVNFTIFMFIFMAYYGHAFGRLMKDSGTVKKNITIMLLMNFLLASVYMTAFSLTGLMQPWWGK
jgi:hypothetical protein